MHPHKLVTRSRRRSSALAAGVISAACACSASLFAQSEPPSSGTRPLSATKGLDLTLQPDDAPELIQLPDMGASANNLMSTADERRLGQAFMRSVRLSVKVIDDPLLSEYIQDLGNRLVSHSPSSAKQFTFFLVDDPQVNAFAGPGGYIGVHTGLVTSTESESELASVVAHEIAHVTQNHLFRAFDEYSRLSGPAALLMLGAVLLGATVSADAGMAAPRPPTASNMVKAQRVSWRIHCPRRMSGCLGGPCTTTAVVGRVTAADGFSRRGYSSFVYFFIFIT